MSDPTYPTLVISVGVTGAVPTDPATIRANILAYMQAASPGYTALPGTLISDILGTEVASIVQCDSAAIEAINCLAPVSANPWVLYLLGQMYGVAPQLPSPTSVYVVFSSASIGLTIPAGFLVGDGTYQYALADGGVIESGGTSAPLFATATQAGSWAVAPNTVTTLLSSVPSPYALTVTNPEAGSPGVATAETTGSYRGRVLQAGIAAAEGMPSYVKRIVGQVPGVQTQQLSVIQVNGGGWEVVVGGGDPYAVAAAIYASTSDISSLVGSTIAVTAITNANPGVVTTNLNHGLANGQSNVHIAGVVGMTGVNGGPYTVTVIDEKRFSFGVNTTSSGAYVSGGVVTPNARNQVVNIIDPPNTYSVPFVVPPAQTCTVLMTWNTDSPNFVSATAVAQLGQPAIAAYIASLAVGQPINLNQALAAFTAAVSSVLPPEYVSRNVWTVSINGVATSPVSGTELIYGDPESYVPLASVSVTCTQG